MSLRVEFLSGADADLQEAFNRFEDYRDRFGVEFMTVIEAYLARIAVFPEIALMAQRQTLNAQRQTSN